MTGQLVLDLPGAPPMARRDDHDTSTAAAETVAGNLTDKHRIVLAIFDRCPTLTDEQLREAVASLGYRWAHGTAGKRRQELVARGLLHPTDMKRPTSTGCMARVWTSVEPASHGTAPD